MLAPPDRRWLKHATRQYDFTFCQESWLDPAKRELRVRATNVSYAGTLVLGDEVFYRAHPTRPDWTAYEASAWMQLPAIPFRDTVETYMVRSYERTTGRGRAIDLEFVNDLLRDGWTAPKPPSAPVAEVQPPTAVQPAPPVTPSAPAPAPAPAISDAGGLRQRRIETKDDKSTSVLGTRRAASAVPERAWGAWVALVVGLGAAGLSPQLLLRFHLLAHLSPSALSLLTTLLSLGWVLVHMRLFPMVWAQLFKTPAPATDSLPLGAAPLTSAASAATTESVPEPLEERDDESKAAAAAVAAAAADDDDDDGDAGAPLSSSSIPVIRLPGWSGAVSTAGSAAVAVAVAAAPSVASSSSSTDSVAQNGETPLRPLASQAADAATPPTATPAGAARAAAPRRSKVAVGRGRAVQEELVGTPCTLADLATVRVALWIERYRDGAYEPVYLVDVCLQVRAGSPRAGCEGEALSPT
jgi:hypothetical protein